MRFNEKSVHPWGWKWTEKNNYGICNGEHFDNSQFDCTRQTHVRERQAAEWQQQYNELSGDCVVPYNFCRHMAARNVGAIVIT